MVDWLIVRMCFVLHQISDGRIRGEIISTLADTFKTWKEAVPKTWNELRKCIETIKSYVSCIVCSALKLIIAILLDMDTDESMKAASTNTFSISLPTKGTFELRITNPSQALYLASSLTHLLALILESRDSQWLMSKLVQIDARLKKWQWCESVQSTKSCLQSMKLDAVTSLFTKVGHRNGQKEAILKSLLWCIRSLLVDEGLETSQLSIEKALEAIWDSIRQTPTLGTIVSSSSLADILKKLPEPQKTKFTPKLSVAATQILQTMSMTHSHSVSDDVPNKRRNIEKLTTIDTVFKHLLTALGITRNASQDHTTQLKSIITEKWKSLSDLQRCTIAESISYLGCASAGKLKTHLDHNLRPLFKCSICDGEEAVTPSKQPSALNLREPLLAIFNKKPASSINVAVIRAFGRLITHDTSPNLFNLSKSLLAERVFFQLRSENRDQRIAATQILPLLFEEHESQSSNMTISENRNAIMRILRSFPSQSHEKPLLETTVMAYSEIGKVATQNDLSFILSTLVDFLGHNNSFIAALAYREILAVAQAHGQTTWQMFSPFWPSISIKVVEQMRSRPQILQRLCEILDIRDSMFLMRTQNFTVPPLVLGKHRDVLEQLSQKMGVMVWEMLNDTMPYILAGIFTQDNRPTGTKTDFLVELMATNKDVKLTFDTKSLISSCRTPLTAELLKMLAGESEGKRERVFQALQNIAMYVSEKTPVSKGGPGALDFVKSYLVDNILELMSYFTDIITDKKGRKTFTEKIGCIAGIQEIIIFAAGSSKVTLPQVLPRMSMLT